VDLEDIMLDEGSQTEDKYSMTSLVCGIENNNTQLTESRMVDTRGGDNGEMPVKEYNW
jgi:hypothetical protein